VDSAGMARNISEKNTRKEMIDPQLEKGGWYLRDHAKVKTEIPVDGEEVLQTLAIQSLGSA